MAWGISLCHLSSQGYNHSCDVWAAGITMWLSKTPLHSCSQNLVRACHPRYMVMFAGKHPFLLASHSAHLRSLRFRGMALVSCNIGPTALCQSQRQAGHVSRPLLGCCEELKSSHQNQENMLFGACYIPIMVTQIKPLTSHPVKR